MPSLNALSTRGTDIILTEYIQHGRAGKPCDISHRVQRQCYYRKHKSRGGGAVCRQNRKRNGENYQQQRAHYKRGHGHKRRCEHHYELIDELIAAERDVQFCAFVYCRCFLFCDELGRFFRFCKT